MKKAIKMSLILVVAAIAGCYYDTEERLYPKLTSPCDDVNVTYSGTVNTILQPCLSCHANSVATNDGGGVKLQEYTDIQTYINNGKLMGSINHSSGYIPMPNGGGKLPDCEISQLQKWIDNNSPNN